MRIGRHGSGKAAEQNKMKSDVLRFRAMSRYAAALLCAIWGLRIVKELFIWCTRITTTVLEHGLISTAISEDEQLDL